MDSTTTLPPQLQDQVRDVQLFTDAKAAYAHLLSLYEESVATLQSAFEAYTQGIIPDKATIDQATYPAIYFDARDIARGGDDTFLSYGMIVEPGVYGTTITDPALMKDYYLSQMERVMDNNNIPVIVGRSTVRIPVTYVVNASQTFSAVQNLQNLNKHFAIPDLYYIHDDIANDTHPHQKEGILPLSLFTAERVDYSLKRLHHYTGTKPKHFQRFIVLTNYQRYVAHFARYAQEQIEKGEGGYTALIGPGDTPFHTTGVESMRNMPAADLPQMPAYHLTRPDGNGITLINIGVGPTNAKNITDHLAVLRPHAWVMIGHCAGLRQKQILGDYVLANAYYRDDQILNEELPLSVPVPALAEIQKALMDSYCTITKHKGEDIKKHLLTGTVATSDDRNWELKAKLLFPQLRRSRAVALDLESGTIAANGFRFRVPYGTLLCVSDKPVHGELKMRSMANSFYEESVAQHLKIGLKALEKLRHEGHEKLHSRKLRGFHEVIFR